MLIIDKVVTLTKIFFKDLDKDHKMAWGRREGRMKLGTTVWGTQAWAYRTFEP